MLVVFVFCFRLNTYYLYDGERFTAHCILLVYFQFSFYSHVLLCPKVKTFAAVCHAEPVFYTVNQKYTNLTSTHFLDTAFLPKRKHTNTKFHFFVFTQSHSQSTQLSFHSVSRSVPFFVSRKEGEKIA